MRIGHVSARAHDERLFDRPLRDRGHAVDTRADIWAFGVVVYKMLTGPRLFAGGNTAENPRAVLTRDPQWDRVPPQSLRLLRRCLVRDPALPLRDIGETCFLIDEAPAQSLDQPPSPLPWRTGAAASPTRTDRCRRKSGDIPRISAHPGSRETVLPNLLPLRARTSPKQPESRWNKVDHLIEI
jgi:serine/threonine protein kinase